MTKKLLATFILAGSSLFAGPHVFVGIGLGGFGGGYVVAPPPPVIAPAPVAAYVPPSPGYGYSWVAPYSYPVNGVYYSHRGYWTRPPYAGAYWVGPRYYGGRYYRGYWRR